MGLFPTYSRISEGNNYTRNMISMTIDSHPMEDIVVAMRICWSELSKYAM